MVQHVQLKMSEFTIKTEDDRTIDVPDTYICPITLNPMVHPLMTRTGRNFERQAIVTWLEQSRTCPLTREPLQPRDLVPNRPLEAQMMFWRKNNGISEPNETELQSFDLPFVGFLQFSEKNLLQSRRHEILAAHSQPRGPRQLPTRSQRASHHSTAEDAHQNNRRFLSRILDSAALELDDL